MIHAVQCTVQPISSLTNPDHLKYDTDCTVYCAACIIAHQPGPQLTTCTFYVHHSSLQYTKNQFLILI